MSATRNNRPLPTRYTTTVRTQPPIDRLANWIARRPRPLRMVIALLISGSLTIAVAIFLYGLLAGADPAQVPLGIETFSVVLLIVAIGAGIAFYWVGWRVMVGFELDDRPLRPGRAAALWFILGIVMLILTIFGVLSTSITAIQN